MGIVGVIITGILLFISAVDIAFMYILLVMASPVKRIASRTVPRVRIPMDWELIMTKTAIERMGSKDAED